MINFKKWINLNEATTDKIIVYHGTPSKNYSSIMSQGLIPNPKQRAWQDDPDTSYYKSSRKSLDGIYVSTNLMTAYSAGRQGGNKGLKEGRLIVICEIQPKTGFMDEDDLNSIDRFNRGEYVNLDLFFSIKTGKDKEYVNGYFKKLLDSFNFNKDLYNGMDNQALNASLQPALWNFFEKSIEREISYLDDYTFQKKMRDHNLKDITKPVSSQAEMNFLKAKEVLTRSLKKMANPLNLKSAYSVHRHASRIMQPIKFSGANKILAIVYIPNSSTEGKKVLYGEVPDQFIKDWSNVMGEWNPE